MSKTSTQKTFTFEAKTDKVLDMMINSIYTNKDVFLRELISNSIDAIEKRKHLVVEEAKPEYDVEKGEYSVVVKIDDKKGTISISDNGIGMSKDEMIKNLGTIAKSGTEEFAKSLDKPSNQIGQFGVGFYSAFIVGKEVWVISKKVGSKKGHVWKSTGSSNYTIEEYLEPSSEGTEVVIFTRDDSKEYLDKFKLKFIAETYSNYTNTKILIKAGKEEEEVKIKSPIWNMDKKSVTKEEYRQLYKDMSHLPDEPVSTIHYRGEGNLEFNAIIFIPSRKPFNLFHPDRQTRIKLYSKKIFIAEEKIDLLPKYLRFAYGVVECNDIPLNISRENLQANRMIDKINTILVKKIFAEFAKIRKNKPEEYQKIWENFSGVIKEGLCDGLIDRQPILSNSLFYTMRNTEKPITLEQYISEMKEGQSYIYYCIGDSIDSVMSKPQLEMFQKKGMDVLLLVDTVDGFWTTVTSDFMGKTFKSTALSSDEISDDLEESESDKESKEDEPKINKDEIVTLFSEALKGKVKEVRLSKKLVESPGCIAIAKGGMDATMERFLIDQKQLNKKSLKIFEINPNHELIRFAVDLMKEEKTLEEGKNMANALFEVSCVAQGETIDNGGMFAKNINKILTKLVK